MKYIIWKITCQTRIICAITSTSSKEKYIWSYWSKRWPTLSWLYSLFNWPTKSNLWWWWRGPWPCRVLLVLLFGGFSPRDGGHGFLLQRWYGFITEFRDLIILLGGRFYQKHVGLITREVCEEGDLAGRHALVVLKQHANVLSLAFLDLVDDDHNVLLSYICGKSASKQTEWVNILLSQTPAEQYQARWRFPHITSCCVGHSLTIQSLFTSTHVTLMRPCSGIPGGNNECWSTVCGPQFLKGRLDLQNLI